MDRKKETKINEFNRRPVEPETPTGHAQVGAPSQSHRQLITNILKSSNRKSTDDDYFSLLSCVNVLLDSCFSAVICTICHLL